VTAPLLALDTSAIIAALLAWHEFHAASFTAVEAALRAPRPPLLPAPVLVEAYAVMTRLPAPHRVAPQDARDLLVGSFATKCRVVALPPSETWRFLEAAADEGVAGGRTYDALILAAARRGGATRLLTLDRRDFAALAPTGIEIVVP